MTTTEQIKTIFDDLNVPREVTLGNREKSDIFNQIVHAANEQILASLGLPTSQTNTCEKVKKPDAVTDKRDAFLRAILNDDAYNKLMQSPRRDAQIRMIGSKAQDIVTAYVTRTRPDLFSVTC